MFANRSDAGRQLAQHLLALTQRLHDDPAAAGHEVIVVGLPRGGVPVAYQVAHELEVPLDVIIVRKLGVPFQPELAMGAIGEGGSRVINENVRRSANVTDDELALVEGHELIELQRRSERFRPHGRRQSMQDRIVIIVDDGVATGSTARAACQVARAEGAWRIILAVPVAPLGWEEDLAGAADQLVCLETPLGFRGVGQFYTDFDQTRDDDVVAHLELARVETLRREAAGRRATSTAGSDAHEIAHDQHVEIPIGSVHLGGHLTIPHQPLGLVLFAHGSGSGRHSPRNRFVARVLNDAGIATLLFDLLTPHEEPDRRLVFDIDLLARRLWLATDWVRSQPGLGALPIGYFGASTGAAAALRAAARADAIVTAVVSRGGRPDLALSHLASVVAPTLLIVGGNDVVRTLNQDAALHLRCEHRVAIVAGATHLFEEPGTLEAAAELSTEWFLEHFASPGKTPS